MNWFERRIPLLFSIAELQDMQDFAAKCMRWGAISASEYTQVENLLQCQAVRVEHRMDVRSLSLQAIGSRLKELSEECPF